MRVIKSKAIECYYDKHGLTIPFKKEYKIKRIDEALLWLYTLTDDEYQDDSGAPRARGRSPMAKVIYPSQKIW